MTNLTDVLEEQIQDLYSAETQLSKCLPKLAKKAATGALKQAFTKHLEETKVQIDRLVQVAEMLEIKPKGKPCKAMAGLVAEGSEVLEESGQNEAIDAALIACAQRVEHYEISAYGTAISLATTVGETKVLKLLQTTLAEEKKTDELLTKVAVDSVYPNAHKTEADESADDNDDEDEMPVVKATKKPTPKAAMSKPAMPAMKKPATM